MILLFDNDAACEKFSARFWSKVDRSGGPDACWPWMAGRHTAGYGMANAMDNSFCAHRMSWSMHNGPIPAGMAICHKCDNPPCVNPAHLFLGTKADNSRDMARKGRSTHGESNPRARLTEAEVLQVRRLRAEGLSMRRIALRVGCSLTNVSVICRGKTWSRLEAAQ